MKKVLFTGMLVFLSFSLYSERLMFIQGAYVNTSRSYSSGSDKTAQNFSEAGLNAIIFYGKKFGFFYSATFLFPFGTSAKVNGTKLDVSLTAYNKMKMGLDAILGPG
ncbi:MAG: hypothetical protein GXP33_02040, partial [Spirochaetes bacterium]|nr:hypothetical protein [Spirochaetota bacterium]